MIQAKELRIGNWIYIDNGEKSKYEYQITAHDIEEIEGSGADCFPIPLTPEILEACGFISFKTNRELTLPISSDESDSLSLTCFDKKAEELSISIEKTGRDDDWNSQYTSTFIPVRSLHQLQNLYFALTASELPVNLQLKKG